MDVEIVIEDTGDVRVHEEYTGESPDDAELFVIDDIANGNYMETVITPHDLLFDYLRMSFMALRCC